MENFRNHDKGWMNLYIDGSMSFHRSKESADMFCEKPEVQALERVICTRLSCVESIQPKQE